MNTRRAFFTLLLLRHCWPVPANHAFAAMSNACSLVAITTVTKLRQRIVLLFHALVADWPSAALNVDPWRGAIPCDGQRAFAGFMSSSSHRACCGDLMPCVHSVWEIRSLRRAIAPAGGHHPDGRMGH